MFYRKSVCYSITSSNSSMKMNVRLRDFSDNEQNKTIFQAGEPISSPEPPVAVKSRT